MKFVLKNLFRRKLRTLFSVLGVGVGVSIMVALFTISDDLVGQIQEAFETQRGDLVVSQATAEELESDVPLYHTEQLQSIEGVKTVSPMIAAILRTDGDFDDRPAILYYGITGNNPLIQHMEMLEGEPISDDDPFGVVFGWRAWEILQEKMGSKAPVVGKPLNLMDVVTSQGFEAVFGRADDWDEFDEMQKRGWALKKLTKELGVHIDATKEESPEEYTARTGREAPLPRPIPLMDDEKYAEWLKLNDSKFEKVDYDPTDPVYAYQMQLQLTTRGVCRTGILLQDSAVFFHLDVAQVIKGKHERNELIKVKRDNRTVTETVLRPESCTCFILEIEDEGLDEAAREARVLAVRDAINMDIDELKAVKSADILQRHTEIEFFEKFGLVISLIAALAGAIGILNTMTLSVYERTREIGLLLAVGWSRTRVLSSVMIEGLILSIVGGAAGVAFGYAEVQIARKYFGLDAINATLNIERSLQAVALAFAIGFVASLYPSIRASLLQPIDALRHE